MSLALFFGMPLTAGTVTSPARCILGQVLSAGDWAYRIIQTIIQLNKFSYKFLAQQRLGKRIFGSAHAKWR